MSATEQATAALIASGMTPAAAAALLARAAVEMNSTSPSKGAMRTRTWRARRASQTVTERHAVTGENSPPQASQTVTKRHGDVTGDAAHISTSLPLISEDEIKEESKLAPRTQKASRLPDDWQPNESNIAFALDRGIPRSRIIPHLADKFRNHWHAKSGKDATSPNWDARWRTWCMNDVDWNGASNGKSRQGGNIVDAARRLEERVKQWDEPPPGGDLCDRAGAPNVRLLSKG